MRNQTRNIKEMKWNRQTDRPTDRRGKEDRKYVNIKIERRNRLNFFFFTGGDRKLKFFKRGIDIKGKERE